MRALSTLELLDVWEQGQGQTPVWRALTLLSSACPEAPPAALEHLSIGQRDARLLTLREWTFGPQLVSLAACPGCHERLELTFSVADLRVAPETEPGEALALEAGGYELRFRLPNSQDMAAVAHHTDGENIRRILLERCLLSAHHGGAQSTAGQLPPGVVEAIVEHMARADPQADVQLSLACPQCGHQWQAAFDIASFFWSEIDAWANRLLREVHILASRYGWREADIVAMGPWRRQSYLNMVSA